MVFSDNTFVFDENFKLQTANIFQETFMLLVEEELAASGQNTISTEVQVLLAKQTARKLNNWYYNSYRLAGLVWIPHVSTELSQFKTGETAVIVDVNLLHLYSFGLEN